MCLLFLHFAVIEHLLKTECLCSVIKLFVGANASFLSGIFVR